MKALVLMGAASVLLGACASSGPVPASKVAQPEAAIRNAQALGADRIPTAAVHLRVANEALNMARQLMAEGDNVRAEYVLLRAQSDAEVALSLAREVQAHNQAQQTLAEVEKLKNIQREGT